MQICKVATVVCVLAIGGCGPDYIPVTPDRTSYPVGLTKENRVSMQVGPDMQAGGRTQLRTDGSAIPLYESTHERSDQIVYDFTRTIKGDTSEREVWAISETPSEFSEEFLFEVVKQKANDVCMGRFYIVYSTYFFGDEAAVAMMGVSTPALRAVIRCPINNAGELNELERQIRHHAAELGDVDFFDYLEKSYAMSKDRLVFVLTAALEAKAMPIITQDDSEERTFIMAGRPLREQKFGRMERLAVIIEGDDERSVIGLILPAYRYTYHKRGVLTRDVKQTGLAPWDRNTAFRRAQEFLGYVHASDR